MTPGRCSVRTRSATCWTPHPDKPRDRMIPPNVAQGNNRVGVGSREQRLGEWQRGNCKTAMTRRLGCGSAEGRSAFRRRANDGWHRRYNKILLEILDGEDRLRPPTSPVGGEGRVFARSGPLDLDVIIKHSTLALFQEKVIEQYTQDGSAE